MSRETIITTLGILVAVMPAIGTPGSWKNPLFVIFGLAIAGLAFFMRQERIWRERDATKERTADTFKEKMPDHEVI